MNTRRLLALENGWPSISSCSSLATTLSSKLCYLLHLVWVVFLEIGEAPRTLIFKAGFLLHFSVMSSNGFLRPVYLNQSGLASHPILSGSQLALPLWVGLAHLGVGCPHQ